MERIEPRKARMDTKWGDAGKARVTRPRRDVGESVAARPLLHPLLTVYRLLPTHCTSVYIILRAGARQKQLAKFKILKIFVRLELPRFRQRIAQFRASNLARWSGVAIWPCGELLRVPTSADFRGYAQPPAKCWVPAGVLGRMTRAADIERFKRLVLNQGP
jgi:hypothetical protein